MLHVSYADYSSNIDVMGLISWLKIVFVALAESERQYYKIKSEGQGPSGTGSHVRAAVIAAISHRGHCLRRSNCREQEQRQPAYALGSLLLLAQHAEFNLRMITWKTKKRF
jgi:hypothetical protein